MRILTVMHNLNIATTAGLVALAGMLMLGRAEAAPLPGAAAAIGAALTKDDLRQDVSYICRRVWRCGPYGCGWRRACYWTPGPFVNVYPHAYAYRPYWRGYSRYWARPYWRGRRYWR